MLRARNDIRVMVTNYWPVRVMSNADRRLATARIRSPRARCDMLAAVGMDPKLVYWTAALVNMIAIVALAGLGVRSIRRREISRHRRLMLAAVVLVALFLVSYFAKVFLLGREQLEIWEASYIWTLRFHEACVLVMVLAGLRALWLGARSGFRDPKRARSHRLAGRTALVSAALGVLTATYVLFGMYARAP